MSNKLYLKRLTSHNNFDMSHYHLTTMDIGFPQIQMCQSVLPTDKLNFTCQAFMRLSPLVFPTYARMRHKYINAYVANYMVDEYFEYAVTGTKQVGSVYTIPMTFKMSDLLAQLGLTPFTTNGTSSNYDFAIGTTGTPAYRKFTPQGRRAYKILKDLGYDIFSFATNDLPHESINQVSAYPLLAYATFVNDVILPQQYKTQRTLTSVLEEIKHRRSSTFTNVGQAICGPSIQGLQTLLHELTSAYSMFRDDYFTTAWRYPNSPTGTPNRENTLKVPYTYDEENIRMQYDKLIDSDDNVSFNSFYETDSLNTSFQLQALQIFDKWVRRNNYIGSSTLNKVYSAFGVKTEQVRSHNTDVINTGSVPVCISDVTSFSDTKSTNSGSELGAYVGKGYSSGTIKCNFKSPDFGYVFCVSYIECDPLYVHGFNRDNLVSSYEDFYQPEFDGMQASPISDLELVSPKTQILSTSRGVFGFQPHYEWMRSKRDTISGDFITLSSMDAWYTAKSTSTTPVAQDPKTLQYSLGLFNNIFQDQGSDVDHFICSFDFDMKMTRPIKTSSQATGLEQGDLVIDKFGNK